MKKLLTLIILAPMVAVAQTTDSAWKPIFNATQIIIDGGGIGVFHYTDTSTVEVTDTVRSQMLVVDTCKDGPVLFVSGYVIRKHRKSKVFIIYSYPEIVGILNRDKKPFSKCYCFFGKITP